MSNNKETQEPLMGQPVELEVVGATEATQAAGEASVRPQREEPLKGRKAARKPAGKEGEAAGEAVEAQGAAREEAATEQPSEEAEAERVAEAIRQAIEEQAREDDGSQAALSSDPAPSLSVQPLLPDVSLFPLSGLPSLHPK